MSAPVDALAVSRPRTRQGNRAGRGVVAEERSSSLAGEFGMNMLRAKFADLADEILAQLGVYSRGPRKGQQRGYIHWRKVTEGGFNYETRSVERRGCYDWRVMDGPEPAHAKDVSQAVAIARIEAESAARIAAHAALPEWRKTLDRAFNARRIAHKELREWAFAEDTAEFHFYMKRARERVRLAREQRDARIGGAQ